MGQIAGAPGVSLAWIPAWINFEASGVNASLAAFKGLIFNPTVDLKISRVFCKINSEIDTYEAFIAEIDGAAEIQTITISPQQTFAGIVNRLSVSFNFTVPVQLTAGARYALMIGRTGGDGTDANGVYSDTNSASLPMPGTTENNVPFLENPAPAIGQTITNLGASTSRLALGCVYQLG